MADTFLLPIVGLEVENPWRIGGVTLHSKESGEAIQDRLGEWDRKLLDSFKAGPSQSPFDGACLAEVKASDVEAAEAACRDTVDLLRVFLNLIANARTATFGLPGDVPSARMFYLQFGAREGLGFRQRGEFVGTEFSDQTILPWETTQLFRLSREADECDTTEGVRRARLAVRIASRAIIETEPALRALQVVMAMEALLGTGSRSKTFQLVRRAAWFTCTPLEPESCGRSRPPCAFLKLDPKVDKERAELIRHKVRAESGTEWRCSQWLDLVWRYEDRSAVAHGDPGVEITAADASRDLYWLIHVLMEPALAWLLDHQIDPAGQLDAALAALPAVPGDWRLPPLPIGPEGDSSWPP
jgi:hypothetical protein